MKSIFKYLLLAIAMSCYAFTVFECFEKERDENYQNENHIYIHAEKWIFQKQASELSPSTHFFENLLSFILPSSPILQHTTIPFSQLEYPPDKIYIQISVLLI
jgi:hypothetical protein